VVFVFTVFEAFKASNQIALMTVLKNNNQWDASNVIFQNSSLIEYNKKKLTVGMNYIDYGLGILSKSIFNEIALDYAFDLADLYHDLSVDGKLAGHEVFDRFYEIGSIAGLKETENYFLNLDRGKL
jgi:NDP-sugar pyrophosphorylase family protein